MSAQNDQGSPLADKTAIGLSLLCAVHCLALPIVIVLAPAIGSMAVADESFHTWMVAFVVPISAYALVAGLRQHHRMSVIYLGVAGISILVVAVVAGHDLLGEVGERGLTLLGTMLVAWTHLQNFRLSRMVQAGD